MNGWYRLAAGLLCGFLLAPGCSKKKKENLAGRLIDRMRECALLGEGIYHVDEPEDERQRCRMWCRIRLSCEELFDVYCDWQYSDAFNACLDSCDPPDHVCSDGQSVPWYWVCDGYDDCEDGSDEADCPEDRTFNCADLSRTIPEDWHCDGFEDCEDGSDEVDCPPDRVFYCADGSGGIRADFRCDAYQDCPDGSDEQDCPPGTMFECADGSRTIPIRERCDGYDQCADGSDEQDCPPGTVFYCADGSGSIPIRWQCDFFDDCADGSDEAGCAQLLCP